MSSDDLDVPEVLLRFVIKNQQRVVGLCSRVARAREDADDSVEWTIISYEFVDNDQFSNLDSLMQQLGVVRIHMTLDAAAKEKKPKGDMAKILNLFERRQCQVIDASASAFRVSPQDLSSQLQRLLKDGSLLAQFTNEHERPLAISCTAALIKVLKLEQAADGSYEMVQGSLDRYVKLDSSAAEAVSLLPDPKFPIKNGSIYGILNQCKTKIGPRLLERWLRQPLVDLEEIEARQDLVQLFKEETSLRTSLRDGPLMKTPDLETLQTRMKRQKAGLAELYRLYTFTRIIPQYLEILRGHVDDGGCSKELANQLEERFLSKFEDMNTKFSLYQKLILTVIDMSALPDLIINPDYDEELQEIKESMNQVKGEIDELYVDARDGWCDFDKDKCLLEPDKVRGFVFRLTKGNLETKLKSKNRNVETVSVLKNGVHFTTPDLRQAGKKYVELKRAYEEQQTHLVEKALKTAVTYLPVCEGASELVAELDVIVSMAHAAALAPNDYVRPKMLPAGSGVLRVTAARHPCVEAQEGISFIPNDYDMTTDKGRFLVLTGPNMGGKSTYIRTLGVIVVMAQIGSFVPAEEAEISIVDAIFARVGAGDAQQRGISTFMAEMLEASAILMAATNKSLIIIDELGRGTSTFDGFGLAWAISQRIVEHTKAFTLFATHFHEMTTMADSEPCVVNKHVTASVDDNATTGEKITFLYEVKDGPCKESYGIYVATVAGFPQRVIREAKRKALALENFENAMENMQQKQLGRDVRHKPERLQKLVDSFKVLPLDMSDEREQLRNTNALVDKMYVGR